VNASGGTWVSTLPNCSSPSALASRGRVDGQHQHLAAQVGGGRGTDAAAAVVVLPTPPEPVDTTISLAEHSCSIVAGATTLTAPPAPRGHQNPSSSPRASAMLAVARTPWER
jgi:hypothetical protein